MASARLTGTNENVSTYNSSGGQDYTALATWEAATDNDLVTGTLSEVLECYDNGTSHDDTISVGGATTDATFFRIVRPASGQVHDGTPNVGVFFSSTSDGNVLRNDEAEFWFQDLIVSSNYSSASFNGNVVFGSSGVNHCGVVGSFFVNSANSGSGSINGGQSFGDDQFWILCSAINNDEKGIDVKPSASENQYIYNCVAQGSGGAHNFTTSPSGGGTSTAKNCLAAGGAGTEDFDNTGGGWTAASVNNASTDSTAGEGGQDSGSAVPNVTFAFVAIGSDDYRITIEDSSANGAGADLSADANFAFDDDIEGNTISDWPIGINEPQPDPAFPFRLVGSRPQQESII